MDGNLYALNQHLAQEEAKDIKAEWIESFREELATKLVNDDRVELGNGSWADITEITDALDPDIYQYIHSMNSNHKGVSNAASAKVLALWNKAVDKAVDNNIDAYAERQGEMERVA